MEFITNWSDAIVLLIQPKYINANTSSAVNMIFNTWVYILNCPVIKVL